MGRNEKLMGEEDKKEKYPLVSVIVPVQNSEKVIEKLLAALQRQNYPHDKMQVIIVDNGSNDSTIEITRKYPFVLAFENEISSSYAARNKGLSLATGEIMVFTDADCIPENNWIEKGVEALLEKNADMAGGKVSFILSDPPTAAEIIDSLTFMQNEQNIHHKHTAVTANLFVRRTLFEQMGLFAVAKSGEDFNWTRKATQRGFSLIYAEQSIIYHPARKLQSLLKKGRRIGGGILKNSFKNKSCFRGILDLVRMFVPVPSRNIMRYLMAKREDKNFLKLVLAIWGVSCLLKINQIAGVKSLIFKKEQ